MGGGIDDEGGIWVVLDVCCLLIAELVNGGKGADQVVDLMF